jgi:PBP1b-binding outer membrane lipoprotein LpoB
MKASIFIVFALLALAIVACAKQETVQTDQTVQPAPEVNIAGDASATQLEQTFDQGFDVDTETAADDINPDDFVY